MKTRGGISFRIFTIGMLLSAGSVGFEAHAQDSGKPIELDTFKERAFARLHALLPDTPGSVYKRLNFEAESSDPRTDQALRLGTRNLEWLTLINSHRPQNKKLSFSSKESVIAFPLDQPSVYNADVVQQNYNAVVRSLPSAMRLVLVEGKPLTSTLPINEKQYLEAGLAVDRVYQIASRWLMMQPYLGYLAARKSDDVRGYYFLSRLTDRDQRFARFDSLANDEQVRLRQWLVQMGMNNSLSDDDAKKEVELAVSGHSLESLYELWYPSARSHFESYFVIPAGVARHDVVWSGNTLHVPFRDPQRADLHAFLQDNIEDEWRLSDWHLLLDFKPNAAAHLEFESGTTPHVDSLGGDVITMDANTPLSEYMVQWTIRHEFGHVLGFPDCYIEFYDSSIKAIVNYQIDTKNLMCSRKGHLLPTHYEQLRRLYSF